MNTSNETVPRRILLPILFGFFVMGFVDIVGIATNYVKEDFSLSSTYANLLPMMVFIWFALCSIPTGILMGKIGKKYTVVISLAITVVAMLMPLLSYSFANLLVAFALLGISNTILQVSLNPLIAGVVSAGKVASTLTLGQFIKSLSSFLGPILVGAAASFWGNWKWTFLLYAAVSLLSLIWLCFGIPDKKEEVSRAGLRSTLSLLLDRKVLLLFLGILFIVGIDVGLNIMIPDFLITRTDLPLRSAGLGTSLYFVSRMAGSFLGALLLVRVKPSVYLRVSMLVAVGAFLLLLGLDTLWAMLILIAIVGLSCASVFSILFSYALQHQPERGNELSALMIMGVSGGALVSPVLGFLSDSFGATAGMASLLFCLLYLGILSLLINKEENRKKV